MANVLLLTHWLGGDVLPFIKIGKRLVKEGHKVILFTHCIYRKEANERGIEFVPVDTMEEYRAMLEDFEAFGDPVRNPGAALAFHENYHGKERCLREMELLTPYAAEPDTIIFCRHRSSIAGLLAAEKLRLPVVSVFLAPNYIAHLKLHEQLLGAAMKEQINGIRRELELPEIESWTGWMCSPGIIIGLWPDWFAPEAKETLADIEEIGFLHDTDSREEALPYHVQAFLEQYPSPVIITGGTSRYLNGQFYQAAVDACAEAQLPAICVCPHDEMVPARLPSNILRTGFIPMIKLMEHALAIIHHGGISTASEAAFAGIPQLVLAFLADRPDNGQRLKEAGIGNWFPPGRWNYRVIGEALLEITEEEFRERCRQRAVQLQDGSAEQRISDIIGRAAGKAQYGIPDRIPVLFEEEQEISQKSSGLSDEKRRLLLKIMREREQRLI